MARIAAPELEDYPWFPTALRDAMTGLLRVATDASAVPVLPAAITWDGFASCLRAYSVAELEALVAPLQRDDYRFRVQRTRIPWRPLYLTSVVGLPR